MNLRKILLSKQIDPSKTIFQITAEEALSSIKEMFNEFSLNVDLTKFSKEELEKILLDYAEMTITYHPEDYHQERASILRNRTILNKYGIKDEDINSLDFV